MKADVYTEKGTKTQSKTALPKEIFGIKPNQAALRQYIHVYQTNQRQGTVSAKTRGEVRGGGKKPWPQKGLGRARHGSIRSPIWVGGGVAHGPRPRSFQRSLPKKVRDLALRSALSSKAAAKQIYVLKSFAPKEPKTSLAAALLTKLGLGRTLVVTPQKDAVVGRSFRNIPRVEIEAVATLNPYQVVKAKDILLLQESIGKLKERLIGRSDKEVKKATEKRKVGERKKATQKVQIKGAKVRRKRTGSKK